MTRSRSNDPVPAVRRPRARPARKSGAGGTLLGVFIGVAIGLALAAIVAYVLMGGRAPYQPLAAAKVEPPRTAAKAEPAPAERPRFDFYKILPGGEEPKVQGAKAPAPPDKSADRSVGRIGDAARPVDTPERTASVEPAPKGEKGAKGSERFWLQTGSFAQESEAENLRARLALSGWEAQVQQGLLPDKGVRYRVRLGPYDNVDELNRVKSQLVQRGFEAAVIRY